MNREEFLKWYSENGIGLTDHSINQINYKFCDMKDGWIGIFEVDSYSGTYTPKIQAKDMPHAISYCAMREPIPVPIQVL